MGGFARGRCRSGGPSLGGWGAGAGGGVSAAVGDAARHKRGGLQHLHQITLIPQEKNTFTYLRTLVSFILEELGWSPIVVSLNLYLIFIILIIISSIISHRLTITTDIYLFVSLFTLRDKSSYDLRRDYQMSRNLSFFLGNKRSS